MEVIMCPTRNVLKYDVLGVPSGFNVNKRKKTRDYRRSAGRAAIAITLARMTAQ